MNISLSKFFIIFILVFFVICVFLLPKSVRVTYKNNSQTYVTYERTVKDVLNSCAYPARLVDSNKLILKKPLLEGMIIEILPDQSIRTLP